MEPSHRETEDFTGPVGRNQPRSVWSSTRSTLLSAGTKDCHTKPTAITSHITDLLHAHSSHGWFSGETGLEVAQDFLHTLSKQVPCNVYTCVVDHTMTPTVIQPPDYLVNVI